MKKHKKLYILVLNLLIVTIVCLIGYYYIYHSFIMSKYNINEEELIEWVLYDKYYDLYIKDGFEVKDVQIYSDDDISKYKTIYAKMTYKHNQHRDDDWHWYDVGDDVTITSTYQISIRSTIDDLQYGEFNEETIEQESPETYSRYIDFIKDKEPKIYSETSLIDINQNLIERLSEEDTIPFIMDTTKYDIMDSNYIVLGSKINSKFSDYKIYQSQTRDNVKYMNYKYTIYSVDESGNPQSTIYDFLVAIIEEKYSYGGRQILFKNLYVDYWRDQYPSIFSDFEESICISEIFQEELDKILNDIIERNS